MSGWLCRNFDEVKLPCSSIQVRLVTTGPYGAQVFTWLFTAAGRYRRPILALGLAAAAAYLTAHIWTPTLTDRALPTLAAASVVLFVVGLGALAGTRPPAFDVRPHVPAFTTLPSAADLFAALGQMGMTTAFTGVLLRDLAQGKPGISPWLTPLFPALMVLSVIVNWRGKGIELRPDGLRDREALGTLVVPWQALPVVPLPVPGDRRNTLRVDYAQPELIRRSGLVTSRKRLNTYNIDPRMAAQVIRYYTTHPEHRSAIGTHVEYQRLLTELRHTPPRPTDDNL